MSHVETRGRPFQAAESKVPEIRMCLGCSKNSQGTSEDGEKLVRGKVVGDEVRGTRGVWMTWRP